MEKEKYLFWGQEKEKEVKEEYIWRRNFLEEKKEKGKYIQKEKKLRRRRSREEKGGK